MYDRSEVCDCFNNNVLARSTAFMTKNYYKLASIGLYCFLVGRVTCGGDAAVVIRRGNVMHDVPNKSYLLVTWW